MTREKKNCIRYIDEHAAEFTDLSDRVWEHPELSLREEYAAGLYCRLLEENGFCVEKNLGGIATAFKGIFGSGRPVIGILGEYDALSGLSQEKACSRCAPVIEGAPGHGCGHNMLGAGSLAAAFAVKSFLEDTQCAGTVIFFGCPGEEGCASKAFLAREGEWKDLDCALTWHPSDVNEVVSGSNNASIQVLYTFHGTAAHAAGDPYNGRSALDAVELLNIGVQFLREHMKDDCRIHYAITDSGGISPNVVQAKASVLYMIRANKVRDTVELKKRVDRIAEGAAIMTETTLERCFIDGTAELVPNFALEQVLQKNLELIPLPEHTAEEAALASAIRETCPAGDIPGIGALFDLAVRKLVCDRTENGKVALNDFVIPLVHTEGFIAGSTDVGDVSWQTPAAQVHVNAFVSGAPGHSWQNVSCAGSTIGHKALLHAGKVLSCTAVDLFTDPQLLAQAREEFDQRTGEGYVCPIEPDAVPAAI